ncbi:response regulator transcription factor [Neobacillus sp. PS3-34]|uniref:response regulator transcription factor n=1 Tax=Neobacillus sp. PS3-34 TaxID=3070678 RepID=UPI0027E11EDD|nr:response regulator transcription factor [Neobacillus sp. PS3-34]WML49851.1 response regulator transcription factor [Neobacillus sp. PS3-34]
MSQSLNNHLNSLLNDAVNLLSVYKEDLLNEWDLINDSLIKTNKKSIPVFQFISEYLLSILQSSSQDLTHVNKLLENLQYEWNFRFGTSPQPEALLFHLNLLENSAHKILKSRIAFSSKLHPSIHYFFSKISEAMLYPLDKRDSNMEDIWNMKLKAPSLFIQWKDAVILFAEWVLRSQNFKESIENICFGFGYFLPFERCALFKFSNTDSVVIGLHGHHLINEEIKAISEQITNIPILNNSMVKLKSQGHEMKNFQPIYIPDAQTDFPEKYIKTFSLGSLIIVPIYVPSEGKIIGGAVLDQGPGIHFPLDRSLLPALMKFGQSSGELLSKFIEADLNSQELKVNTISLTQREIEIIKLLADGASTSEAAVKLYLSEFTVRDYISSIMKRLNARNRTEVAVKAIRMGIIE